MKLPTHADTALDRRKVGRRILKADSVYNVADASRKRQVQGPVMPVGGLLGTGVAPGVGVATTTTTTATASLVTGTTATGMISITTARPSTTLASATAASTTVSAGIPSSTASTTRPPESHSNAKIGTIIGVVVAATLCIVLGFVLLLRWLRKRGADPKYVPTTRLKELWHKWTPGNTNARYSTSLQNPSSIMTGRPASGTSVHMLGTSRNATAYQSAERMNNNNNEEVDRRQSVRSILTLPPYSADARPTEKILGREGEREGIDTIVDFPETNEEVEARREEEMESLYQIRIARREARRQRDERRQQRREARARGDQVRLEELRAESTRRHEILLEDDGTTPEAMIAEHQARDRGRRVSSVEYASIGLARHDGSRVRAGSNDSDRPLLDSAAPQGQRRGSGAQSVSQTLSGPYLHTRGTQSTSTLRFMTPDYSDDEDTYHARHGSTSDFEMVSTSRTQSREASNSRPGTSSTAARPRGVSRDGIPQPPPLNTSVTSLPSSNATGVVGVGAASGPSSSDGSPPQYSALSNHHEDEIDQTQQHERNHSRVRSDVPVSPLSPAPPYESPTSASANDMQRTRTESVVSPLSTFGMGMVLPSIEITPFSPVLSEGEAEREER